MEPRDQPASVIIMVRTPLSHILGLLLGALIGIGCGTSASPPIAASSPERQVTVLSLTAASLTPIRVSFADGTDVVRTLRGRFPTDPGDRVQQARAFLRRHAPVLGLSADLAELELDRRVESPGGVTVVFSQRHRGVEVFHGAVVVAFDRWADIIHVHNATGLALALDVLPEQGPDAAVFQAQKHLGLQLPSTPADPRLMVVRGGKDHPGWHLAWRVEVQTRGPRPAEWYVFVSAGSGRVVRVVDRLKRGGAPCVPCTPAGDPACGLVLFENPVDALNDPYLTDSSNVNSVQTGCVLGNLTSTTRLDGLYVTTSLSMPRVAPPYDTLRSGGQTALDEVNVYYHVNRAKEYLNTLGYTSVMSYAIAVDAHDSSLGDNSYYSPTDLELHFGEGGVDDAQDADVVYHEYGHAIQDNQVPGYGASAEGGATGEGFGDYWAAAITDDSFCEPALGAACVAGWDAVSYHPYDGSVGSGCLRRLDSAKQYPEDFEWEVHADGEIWSAALWDLRAQLGGATLDALVLQSHTYLTASAGFIHAADGLLSADVALHGGANGAAIHEAMRVRGIPRTGTPADTSNMSSWVSYNCSTGHNYASEEYTECSYTVPGADRVRFRFSSFNTESGWDYVYISDPDLMQVERLSGNLGNNVLSAAVSGDTIVARFKADGATQRYGFDIDRVYYSSSTCTSDSDCDDNNPCTDDVCDGANGCVYANNTVGCNDGNQCTYNDQCVAGSCVGGSQLSCDDGNPCNGVETCHPGVGCQLGTPPTCNDGNPCTDDYCDPTAGGCRWMNNTAACSDGNQCTYNDQCVGGSCVGGSVLSCDDSNPCNGVETCHPAGGCQAGSPLSCNDYDPCTYDSCHPATGCTHQPICGDAGVPDGSTPWPDGSTPWPDGSTPPADAGADGATQPPVVVTPVDSFSPRPGCSCRHPGGSAVPGFPLVLALLLLLALRRRRGV